MEDGKGALEKQLGSAVEHEGTLTYWCLFLTPWQPEACPHKCGEAGKHCLLLFPKGKAQCLIGPRSQRDRREDQQIECRSFKLESCAERCLYQTCSPSSDAKSLYFKSGHSFPCHVSEVLSSCCSISGQEKEGQGLAFILA